MQVHALFLQNSLLTVQSLPQVPQLVALLVRFTHPTPAQFV
jgi:hypothetical protein